MTPYGGTNMAQIARERDQALAEVERLNTALDNMRAEYMANLNRLEPEVKRLRKALQAARDKFAELELPVYAKACDATLLASPG